MPRKDLNSRAEYQKLYAEQKKEELRAYRAQYRKNNAELIKAKKKQAWAANREVELQKLKDRYASDPEYWREYSRQQYRKNPDKSVEYSQSYRERHPEKVKLGKQRYAIQNNHVINAAVARRKALKRNQTPKWVDSEELWLITEVYALAKERTKMTGFSWHVDHIVPIQGKLASGLHTIHNLQVIPATENIRKSNRYEVDL